MLKKELTCIMMSWTSKRDKDTGGYRLNYAMVDSNGKYYSSYPVRREIEMEGKGVGK